MEAPRRHPLATLAAGDSSIGTVDPAQHPSSRIPRFAPAPERPGLPLPSWVLRPALLAAALTIVTAGTAGVAAAASRPGGPAAEPGDVVVVAGGDVTLGGHLEEYLREQAIQDATLDPQAYPFARIARHLRGADLALVNLEGPFTRRGQRLPKNFNFRASPYLAAALAQAGIGAGSLANNHTMDYGVVGMQDTLAALDHEGIVAFGAGLTLEAARRGAVVARRGMRIGLLGYLFLNDHSIEPPVIFAGPGHPGVAGHPWSPAAMEAMVREDVGNLRPRVDAVVVSFHWGRERRYEPEAYRRRLGRAAVEAGAQVVVGHHPHVIQGIEAYRGGLIAYSLGNFVFGGKWKPDDTDAILLKVHLRPSHPAPNGPGQGGAAGGPGGAAVTGYEVVPIATGLYPDAPFQPVELTGSDAARVRARLERYSGSLLAR